jgi:hypothetical protein
VKKRLHQGTSDRFSLCQIPLGSATYREVHRGSGSEPLYMHRGCANVLLDVVYVATYREVHRGSEPLYMHRGCANVLLDVVLLPVSTSV